jgi:hypothetical protein
MIQVNEQGQNGLNRINSQTNQPKGGVVPKTSSNLNIKELRNG